MDKLKNIVVNIEAGGKYNCKIHYTLDKDGNYTEYLSAGNIFLRDILYTKCKYVLHDGERLEIGKEDIPLTDDIISI